VTHRQFFGNEIIIQLKFGRLRFWTKTWYTYNPRGIFGFCNWSNRLKHSSARNYGNNDQTWFLEIDLINWFIFIMGNDETFALYR
jgi:hypothetical protein